MTIDGIVKVLKKMESKLHAHAAEKQKEAEAAFAQANAAAAEVERASKIAGNLGKLLGE